MEREGALKQAFEFYQESLPTFQFKLTRNRESNDIHSQYMYPATNFLARKEIMLKSENLIKEELIRFWTWLHGLENKISGLRLSALDIITILEVNTDSPAFIVGNKFSPVAGVDAQNALLNIISELKRRFGIPTYIADNLTSNSMILLDLAVRKLMHVCKTCLNTIVFLESIFEKKRIVENKNLCFKCLDNITSETTVFI